MRKVRVIFLIIFTGSLFFWENLLFSQNYPIREYTVLDGLPQSQSSGIFQDSRGFIWISTRNGLSRFDGVEFVNYFRKDGLSTNFINHVFEDNNGQLYALGSRGLSRFDGQKFINFPPPGNPSDYSFISGSPTQSTGTLLLLSSFTGSNSTILFSFENGIYKNYSELFPELNSLRILFFQYDKNGNEFLILDFDGYAWSWRNNKLYKISGQKFKKLSMSDEKIILWDEENIFEYSDNNIRRIEKNAGKWIDEHSISARQEFGDSLVLNNYGSQFVIKPPFGKITGTLIDKESILWFASERNLFRLVSTAFSSLKFSDGLVTNIWSLAEDRNGHLWFGSLYGDLLEYDGKKFRMRNDYKPLFKYETGFFKGNRKMSNGDIYFSTSQGVLVYDGKSFSRIKGIEDFTQVCYIYEDTTDKLVFLGTNRGLYKINKDTTVVYPEFIDENLGVIEGMVRMRDGKYWLSGHKGLILFDRNNFVKVSDTILPKTDTYTIEKDFREGLWITSEEGLFFKEKSSDSFLLGIPEALNRPANSLIMIDSSSLLVGRTTDICIIDLEKFYNNEPDYFRLYDKSDGFSGNDCLDNGIIKDKAGRFLILTSNGVDILEPQKIKRNQIPPRVYITEIERETDSLTWKTISEPDLFYKQAGELRLNRKQNTLRIGFTGISTTNPEKVTYQYRLSGYQEHWSVKTTGRKALYEKLSPGFYTFQVKAFNADDISDEEPCSISFRIIPAFWQTLFFRILILLFIIAVAVLTTLITMKYLQKRRKEHEKLQSRLLQLHMGSVIKQFDPHFTFNVLSSVGSLIMKGEKEMAYDYLLKLSGLLRSIISDGTAIIKPLSEEIDFVTRYCEVQKLRFKERLEWSINVGKGVNLLMDVPKLTIQIFVENAIKHGIENKRGGGRVDISLLNSGSGLEISIIDNGIGRAAARRENSEGTGHGINLISGLFDNLNAGNKGRAKVEVIDLLDNMNTPAGTEVRIFIPEDYQFGFAKHS